jgi:hypothetical protein
MPLLADYYNEIGLKKKDRIDNLFQIPKKDNRQNMPHFESYPGNDQQADLLYLPTDKGFKYALVVVDIATGVTDAEPLKTKTSQEVKEGFKKIYMRKKLKFPNRLSVDNGTEFKGVVAIYFDQHDVLIRRGEPYRHRQQALAESRNKTISTALFKRMTAQEELTGEVSTHWIKDLPKVIDSINKSIAKRKPKVYPDVPTCSGDSCILLPLHAKVRASLSEPISNITGAHESGRFRATDIRFNPKIRTVTQRLLRPGQPPMYLLDTKPGEKIIAYTKNQLQVVSGNDTLPDPNKVIRGKPKHYIVDEILDKKKEKNRIFYLVKWKGFKETTWEPRAKLLEDGMKLLIEDYENHSISGHGLIGGEILPHLMPGENMMDYKKRTGYDGATVFKAYGEMAQRGHVEAMKDPRNHYDWGVYDPSKDTPADKARQKRAGDAFVKGVQAEYGNDIWRTAMNVANVGSKIIGKIPGIGQEAGQAVSAVNSILQAIPIPDRAGAADRIADGVTKARLGKGLIIF